MRRRIVPVLAALVAQALAAAWLTWPLASLMGTHLPARFGRPAIDSQLLGWALAHETRALVGGWSSLPHAPAFHPSPWALFYGEAGFGALPFFAPVFLATGNPTLGSNATLLGGVVLTAAAIHLVVARLTGSWLGGLVAGATFLTAHWVLWAWVIVAPNYAVLCYLPVILLLCAEGVGSVGRAAALGALVLAQGLTSVYVAASVVVTVGVIALVRLARRATRREGARLVAALLGAAVGLAAAYCGYLAVRRANPGLGHQTLYALVPLGRSRLPWGALAGGLPMGLPWAAFVLVAAGLACHLARREASRAPDLGRAWAAGALWAAVGFVISLTPVATWDGRPVVLPHAWIARWVPVYAALRDPARLGVVGLVGEAVLAGVAFAACARRLDALVPTRAWPRVGLAAVVVAGLYATYLQGFAVPQVMPFAPLPRALPLAAAPRATPALVAALAAHPGPVLELPVAGPESHAAAMYRSIFHRQPVLNGYHGYWPEDFPERMRLACRLPEAAALAELRRTTGVATLVVHADALDQATPSAPPYGCAGEMPHGEAWRDAAAGRRGDLGSLGRVDDALLFAVLP